MNVMKFGGSCLETRRGLLRMIELIQTEPRPLVIVLSALKGVTDDLIQHLDRAHAEGEAPDLDALRRRHHEALEGVEGERAERARGLIGEHFEELERLLRGVAALREVPPRTRDQVLGLGERLSVLLAHAHLDQAGIPAELKVAADAGVLTTDESGDARLLAKAYEAARAAFDPKADVVTIVPGFVGHDRLGRWTTLGRGGSDTTATFLAAALSGTAVLWKDTRGLLTGDPRVVSRPQVITQLNYRDALELAHYGLPAVHHKAIGPAHRARIPIEIRSFLDGLAPSKISEGESSHLAITCVPQVIGLDLQEATPLAGEDEPLDQPAAAQVLLGVARFLRALARAGVTPLLLTEASPQGEVTVILREGDRDASLAALDKLSPDLEVTTRGGLALVSLIGSAMKGQIGVAASVFAALSAAAINIDAIAQTGSERNISVVVDRDQARPAVRALHQRFVEDPSAG